MRNHQNFSRLAVMFAALFFVVDITIPLGVAAGVPYVLSVLLAGQTHNKKFLIGISIVCSLLTLLGFWLSPAGVIVWQIVANRILALVAIWSITYVFLANVQTGTSEKLHSTVHSDFSALCDSDEYEIAPSSVSEFFEYFRRSELVENSVIDELHDIHHSKEAGEVAKILVADEVLTKYQATKIFHGQYKALRFGEYLVLDQIGNGGVGLILRAQHRFTGQFVAIKVLQNHAYDSKAIRKRFAREIEATLALDHPNIIRAFSGGVQDGLPFLIVEFVDGLDLSKEVELHGPVGLEDAISYVVQAGRGIAHAHSHGVIHRDVKPSNLLLTAESELKVLDLGLATYAAGQTVTAGELTKTGSFCGTIDFMAPEQVVDFKNVDQRADVFSLGQTFRFLLCGHSFLPGFTHREKINALATSSDVLVKPLESSEAIPENVQEIFRRMIEPEVDKRIETMEQVLAELEPFLTDSTETASEH